jgi:hypothetical protein
MFNGITYVLLLGLGVGDGLFSNFYFLFSLPMVWQPVQL